MSDILEQVGITKDELIARIVDKALGITADYKQTGEETWEDIPLSSVVDRAISTTIGNLVDTMKPMIESRISEIMDAKITEVFTLPFQRKTRWGESVGEPTTIKDIIADEATGYWTTKVDANSGKPSGGGFSSTVDRASYYAKRVMTEIYNKELSAEVKKLATEMKAKIPATISEEISKTIVGYLK